MAMKPSLRKFALTTHITLTVGWFGAAVAYLALAFVGLTSHDTHAVQAAYISMELIGWFVIIPFSLAALVTGLIESLGTSWGLFRHWWVLIKFLMTVGATLILLQHIPAVTEMANIARELTLSVTDFRELRIQLVVHSGGSLLVLFGMIVLSVYKPWGMSPYGLRMAHERQQSLPVIVRAHEPDAPLSSATRTQSWTYIVGLHAIGLFLLFLAFHLGGRGWIH